MTFSAQSVLAELDTALSKAPRSKHEAMLRAVANLFFGGAKAYSKAQVAVFGDVMSRLIGSVDSTALIELSARLAAIDNAPGNVVEQLSSHDDIAIAGPLLGKSEALAEDLLLGIAKAKGQRHLTAIAGRSRIGSPITDLLLERGNIDVARKVIANQGARISELGFVKLIKKAESEPGLTTLIAGRTDLPHELRPFLKHDQVSEKGQPAVTNAEAPPSG